MTTPVSRRRGLADGAHAARCAGLLDRLGRLPELFFWNTHNTYLLGLDPTYMYLYDPSLYLQWRAITRGQVDLPGAIIRDVYDSGWVFSDLDHEAFIRKAAADPELQEVYRTGPPSSTPCAAGALTLTSVRMSVYCARSGRVGRVGVLGSTECAGAVARPTRSLFVVAVRHQA